MEISDTERLRAYKAAAEILVRRYLGPKWKVKWDRSKKTFGTCSWLEITLSKPKALAGTADELVDTIYHEISHGLTYFEKKSHGPMWSAVAKELGVSTRKAA